MLLIVELTVFKRGMNSETYLVHKDNRVPSLTGAGKQPVFQPTTGLHWRRDRWECVENIIRRCAVVNYL